MKNLEDFHLEDPLKDDIENFSKIDQKSSDKTLNTRIKSFFKKILVKRKYVNSLDSIQSYSISKQGISHLNSILTLILALVLIVAWFSLPLFAEAKQLKNDLLEQRQIIDVEKKNHTLLEELSEDKHNLLNNIQKIYIALPKQDESMESIISMIEDIATKNRVMIEAISARKIPENQIYYDDLIGRIGIYEYSLAIDSELPNILGFIASIRDSTRLMDMMTLEIEDKGNGFFRAGFVLNAYHLEMNDHQT